MTDDYVKETAAQIIAEVNRDCKKIDFIVTLKSQIREIEGSLYILEKEVVDCQLPQALFNHFSYILNQLVANKVELFKFMIALNKEYKLNLEDKEYD